MVQVEFWDALFQIYHIINRHLNFLIIEYYSNISLWDNICLIWGKTVRTVPLIISFQLSRALKIFFMLPLLATACPSSLPLGCFSILEASHHYLHYLISICRVIRSTEASFRGFMKYLLLHERGEKLLQIPIG